MSDEPGQEPSDEPNSPMPQAAWWQPATVVPPLVAAPVEPPPDPPRRRWRKPLVVTLVVVLLLGGAGAGVAAAIDHRHDQQEQERIAAEHRAADAYVKAVRPLAERVFDAVQPIQNALDAIAKVRPGIFEARDDVILRSGAISELAAVRKALVATSTPIAQQPASLAMEAALKDLAAAIQDLQTAVRAAAKETEPCHGCLAVTHLDQAELRWTFAVGRLDPTPPPSTPARDGGVVFGKARATWGGFMHASDLICAAGGRKMDTLPDRSGTQVIKNLPALARIFRSTIASLRAVKAPGSRASLDHQLDVQLRGVASLADTFDDVYAAWKARSPRRYRAAVSTISEQLRASDELGKTYKAHGMSVCAAIFVIPDEDLDRAYAT